MTKIKVAVVQAAPVFFNLEKSVEKVDRLTMEARQKGAQLVLFPESFLPCYPRGLGFGTVVGSRSDEGREQWLLYWKNAVVVPGKITDQLGFIARQHEVFLAIGVTERSSKGGTLYCSLLYFSPAGTLIGHHRKIKPTGAERIIWGEGNGSDLQVLQTPIGKVGGLICWENYMPNARMKLYEQDVQIYLAPTADYRSSWQASMQHIACEGRCFVLGCNQFVRKDMYPDALQAALHNQPAIMCQGGSVIVSPLGEVLAGPLYGTEGTLFATLDLEEVIKSKMDFDAIGHYSWQETKR